MLGGLVVLFFFFKQKTAYEMRISDWSSDVCSSDLIIRAIEVNDGAGLLGHENAVSGLHQPVDQHIRQAILQSLQHFAPNPRMVQNRCRILPASMGNRDDHRIFGQLRAITAKSRVLERGRYRRWQIHNLFLRLEEHTSELKYIMRL